MLVLHFNFSPLFLLRRQQRKLLLCVCAGVYTPETLKRPRYTGQGTNKKIQLSAFGSMGVWVCKKHFGARQCWYGSVRGMS